MPRYSKESPSKRGYDRAWKKLRDQKLAADPFCECDDCAKRPKWTRPRADTVDHIKPISERPDLRLVWSNLRSMVKSHHDRRTVGDQHSRAGHVRRGADAEGRPIDPNHHWNRKP